MNMANLKEIIGHYNEFCYKISRHQILTRLRFYKIALGCMNLIWISHFDIGEDFEGEFRMTLIF